jgi:hypothetical protein
MKHLLGYIFGVMFGIGITMSHYSDLPTRECTITIKDMQGVKHIIKGVADE